MRFLFRAAALCGMAVSGAAAFAETPVPRVEAPKLSLTPTFFGGSDGASTAAPRDFLVAPTISLMPSALTLDDMPMPPRAPLMAGLDKIGLAKPLDSLGINIYGYIESGYYYDTLRTSKSQGNFGHLFTYNPGNHYMLNQVDLSFERTVDPTKWDIGGKVEVIYGTDARYVHANGLTLYQGMTPDSPTNQFDFEQAYLDIGVPVGNGLKIRVGKFVTLFGAETINPNTVPFYSRSYMFNYMIPFTHTGVLGFYTLNDQWSLTGGVVRGWDQSLEDNNGAVSVIGEVQYTPSKQWNVAFIGMTGPEDAHDTSHYRTLLNVVANWQVTDKFSMTLDADWAYDGAGDLNGRSNDWYGVALYQAYVINDYLTFNAREEWFHDGDGSRLAVANGPALNTILGSNVSVNAYELTLGVTITPMPKDPFWQNLKIRPELRWDHSEDHIFSGGDRQDALLVGGDVIFKF